MEVFKGQLRLRSKIEFAAISVFMQALEFSTMREFLGSQFSPCGAVVAGLVITFAG